MLSHLSRRLPREKPAECSPHGGLVLKEKCKFPLSEGNGNESRGRIFFLYIHGYISSSSPPMPPYLLLHLLAYLIARLRCFAAPLNKGPHIFYCCGTYLNICFVFVLLFFFAPLPPSKHDTTRHALPVLNCRGCANNAAPDAGNMRHGDKVGDIKMRKRRGESFTWEAHRPWQTSNKNLFGSHGSRASKYSSDWSPLWRGCVMEM